MEWDNDIVTICNKFVIYGRWETKMIIRKKLLYTLGITIVLSGTVVGTDLYAANAGIISAGAGKILSDAEISVSDDSSSDFHTISIGEAQESRTASVSANMADVIAGLDEEKEATIAGYTNLGIAKVDNWLNVREDPSEDGKVIGKMPKNAGCEILDDDGEWAHIKSGKVEGYSKLEYLYIGDEAKEKAEECISLMATVTTTTLFVREEPNTDASVITMVPMDEELEVIEDLDEWCKISVDSEEGYISKEFATISEKLDKAVTIEELKYGEGVSDVRVALVNYAKQFLGNRYVWGGTSLTNGTDCSGFTMGVYKNFGISLPRVSRSQATMGTKVSSSEMKPGDLIFYGKGNYINHVGIYIGGGQVIHASSPKTGIKISNAFYRTPITIRRIIND